MSDPRILIGTMRLIDPFNIHPDDVDLRSIIAALCRLPRYSGQTRKTYRVAEHVVHLYRAVPEHLRKAVLLHEASEGMGFLDLPHPIKMNIPFYKEMEEKLLRVVFAKFDVPYRDMIELNDYDRRICQDEMLQVFPEPWNLGLEPLGDVTVEFWGEEYCLEALTRLFVKEGLINA